MSDDKRWEGKVLDTTGELPTKEEIEAAAVAMANKEPLPVLVHPIGHRDMMVIQGYPKEKANKAILKIAKEQGFSKESLERLKEGLEE